MQEQTAETIAPTTEVLENVESINPSIVEEKMVEKALAEDPSGTPADKAAAFFKMSAPKLNLLLKDMSHNQLIRMVMNVATYPFLDRNYEVKKGSLEEKASYRFNEMVWQKTIMQFQFEMQKAEQAMKEQRDQEQLSLIKGETNGTETKNE